MKKPLLLFSLTIFIAPSYGMSRKSWAKYSWLLDSPDRVTVTTQDGTCVIKPLRSPKMDITFLVHPDVKVNLDFMMNRFCPKCGKQSGSVFTYVKHMRKEGISLTAQQIARILWYVRLARQERVHLKDALSKKS